MPAKEAERLNALAQCCILDTPPEAAFDRIAHLAARLFDTPIALVSLVDAERQWFKARVGIDVPSTDRGLAFCAHAIELGPDAVLVVKDAKRDPRFRNNPLVTGEPYIRFYMGAVLTTAAGHNLGTLCVIDRTPRQQLNDKDLDSLRTLAKMVVDEIERRREQRETEETLRFLRMAKQMAGFGQWRMDLLAGKTTWSDKTFQIYGVEPHSVEPGLKHIMSLCEPQERRKFQAAVEEAVVNKTGYEVNLEIQWPNGEIRYVIPKCICELDPAGNPIALVGVVQDVTERVRSAKALEEHARRTELAEEVAGLGHWRVDRTGQISWSPQMYAIHGLDPAKPLDLTDVKAMVDPQDWAARDKAEAHALATGEASGQQIIRLRRATGDLRYVRQKMAAERGPDGSVVAVVGAALDITDLMQAEMALARSEARYKLLAENSTDLILQCDTAGVVTYVSPCALEITGFSADHLIGREWGQFVRPKDAERLRKAIAAQISSGTARASESASFGFIHADGRLIRLEGRPTLTFDAKTGAVTGFTAIVRDVSQRHSETEALRRARVEAETAMAAKTDFLANMSHELRTPLTAVLGFAQLLREQTDLTEGARGYLDRIANGGHALLTTVNDILDFSKLEAGQVEIKPRAVAPTALAAQALGLFALQAEEKSLALVSTGLDALPASVSLDTDRVRQILLNLIRNAVKFTDKGEVRLEAAYDEAAGRLSFAVIDTGPGLSEEDAARLFERRPRAEGAIARPRGGGGLGLPICKGLVEAMGGDIGVESVRGQGSRFWFTLPAAKTDAPLAVVADGPGARLPSGCRVLLAEDNAVNRALACAILIAWDADIVEVCDGLQAVQAAQSEAFDVILMDLRMPNLAGEPAARQIRGRDGPNKATPIVAFTADMAAHIDPALFDGAVAKPIVPIDLIGAVIKVLAPKGQPSEAGVAA